MLGYLEMIKVQCCAAFGAGGWDSVSEFQGLCEADSWLGCKVRVFGANPGPPLPEEIWLQVREANVWAMPPPPWAVNTAVAWETSPNIPAPHGYLYQDSLSCSGLVWPLNPALSWVT